MMLRLLATATAATGLVFSPTPGVLVLSPALTGPRTTFSVGPHAGESYERVWREDPQFCVWALEQPAPRAELEDFQAWLRSKSKARRAPVKLTMRRPKPIVPTPVAYPDTLEPDVVLQHQEVPVVHQTMKVAARILKWTASLVALLLTRVLVGTCARAVRAALAAADRA